MLESIMMRKMGRRQLICCVVPRKVARRGLSEREKCREREKAYSKNIADKERYDTSAEMLNCFSSILDASLGPSYVALCVLLWDGSRVGGKALGDLRGGSWRSPPPSY